MILLMKPMHTFQQFWNYVDEDDLVDCDYMPITILYSEFTH